MHSRKLLLLLLLGLLRRTVPQGSFGNHLIRGMSAQAFNALRPGLQRLYTIRGQGISQPDAEIEFTYFPDAGHASVVATSEDREEIEIGIVGREGAVGLALSAALRRTPLKSTIQVSGPAWRIASLDLINRAESCPELRRYLELFERYMLILTAYTVLSHNYSIPKQLARWILMAHDRAETDELHVTHQSLALMLGVRRAGITEALHVLEGERAIKPARGVLQVTCRKSLREFAKGSYGAPEREYQRLFGMGFAKPF